MSMTRVGVKLFALLSMAIIIFCQIHNVDSRPSGHNRVKRVSDQRLAELETILGLRQFRGQKVRVKVAFGKVDPKKIGRRRRASNSMPYRAYALEEYPGDNERFVDDLTQTIKLLYDDQVK